MNVAWENKGINIIEQMIKDKSCDGLEENQKQCMAGWVFIHFVRNPCFKERILYKIMSNLFEQHINDLNLPEGMKKALAANGFQLERVPILKRSVDEAFNHFIANKNNNLISHLRNNLTWKVAPGLRPKIFYTSDNPVSITDEKEVQYDAKISSVTFNEQEISFNIEDISLPKESGFSIPISPELCLLIRKPEHEPITEIGNVSEINMWTTAGALRYVYARDADFCDAIACLRDHPDWRERRYTLRCCTTGEKRGYILS